MHGLIQASKYRFSAFSLPGTVGWWGPSKEAPGRSRGQRRQWCQRGGSEPNTGKVSELRLQPLSTHGSGGRLPGSLKLTEAAAAPRSGWTGDRPFSSFVKDVPACGRRLSEMTEEGRSCQPGDHDSKSGTNRLSSPGLCLPILPPVVLGQRAPCGIWGHP